MTRSFLDTDGYALLNYLDIKRLLILVKALQELIKGQDDSFEFFALEEIPLALVLQNKHIYVKMFLEAYNNSYDS